MSARPAGRESNGGAEGSRTPGLVIANDALYQLSYSPTGESVNKRTTGGRAQILFLLRLA